MKNMATKEQIEHLIKLLTEISNQPGNEWVKHRINPELEEPLGAELSQIYEYCIKNIAKEQAEKFYENFKIIEIRQTLIADFIRMETFRRNDNFEDFCLAAFQQIESITNHLAKQAELKIYIQNNRFLNPFKYYDKNRSTYVRKSTDQNIGKLIFAKNEEDYVSENLDKDPLKWFFTHRFRAVLFYYHFNLELGSNSEKYESIYELGNYLYQARNLNHRSGEKNKYQDDILNQILPNKYNYYYKFMGFIEEFSAKINQNLIAHTNF
ncbi:MAG: hypothetical protein RL108_918 [Bacteroidota bacterium]|jgi:hypothetical protein